MHWLEVLDVVVITIWGDFPLMYCIHITSGAKGSCPFWALATLDPRAHDWVQLEATTRLSIRIKLSWVAS